MRITKIFSLITLSLLAFSCQNKGSDQGGKAQEDYYRGKLTLLADDAYFSVSQALAEGYSYKYPEAHIDVQKVKENMAINQLLNGQAEAIMISRTLNDSEQKLYTQQAGQEYKPAAFAADAVVFITSKNSARASISVDEIQKMLKDPAKPLIFDGSNAGNFNYVAEKFKVNPQEMKFSALPGNSVVAESISKYPNSVGVVSLGTFSREYDSKSITLRNSMKILPVTVGDKSYLPEPKNLANFSYPFTRTLYMLTNERGFKMANGLMRFAGSQTGQMIVAKEGLQPYYLYKRMVKFH